MQQVLGIQSRAPRSPVQKKRSAFWPPLTASYFSGRPSQSAAVLPHASAACWQERHQPRRLLASGIASAVDAASGFHLYVKHHSIICVQCAAPRRALGGAPCATGAALLPLHALHALTKQFQNQR